MWSFDLINILLSRLCVFKGCLCTCFSCSDLAASSCASTISRSAVIWTLSLRASSSSSIRSVFWRRVSYGVGAERDQIMVCRWQRMQTSLQSKSSTHKRYLHLLGGLRQIVLPLSGFLHEPSIPAFLHLLLVLQRRHLLCLVLHLPKGTSWDTRVELCTYTSQSVVPLDK